MVFQAAVCSDHSQLGFSAHVIVEADELQDLQGELAGWRPGRVRGIPSSEGWQAFDTQEELMFPFKASEHETLACRETGNEVLKYALTETSLLQNGRTSKWNC